MKSAKKAVEKEKKAPLRGAQRLPETPSPGGRRLPTKMSDAMAESGPDGAGPSKKTPSPGGRRLPRKKTSADGDIGGHQQKTPDQKPTQERGLGEELDIRTAGLVPWRNASVEGSTESNGEMNPLLKLGEEDRAKLFIWLRECPYDDAVKHVLKDQGLGDVSSVQLMEFFQTEAQRHWEMRVGRAAVEANALVELVEKSPVKFSSGILAALGQEAFRQIASGEVAPESMGKIATLFLRARSDERSEQMQELRRERLKRELQGQIGHALEKLAEEVEKHPAARAAFAELQREIERNTETEEGNV